MHGRVLGIARPGAQGVGPAEWRDIVHDDASGLSRTAAQICTASQDSDWYTGGESNRGNRIVDRFLRQYARAEFGFRGRPDVRNTSRTATEAGTRSVYTSGPPFR